MMMSATNAETCGRCHSPHGEESIAPKACIGCHEDQATEHQTTDDPGTGSCLACHRQHDAKANALARCAEYHAKNEPRISAAAMFRGGHDACTTCHTPHEFSRRTVKACTSCHANQLALAAKRVGAHRDCRNCHDQHDVKSNGQRSCKRCHERVAPSHSKNARGDDCLGCHPAHPARAEVASAAVACATCHTLAPGRPRVSPRRRLQRLPPRARVPGRQSTIAVSRLPLSARRTGEAGNRQHRPWRLRELSWRQAARAGRAADLRELPCRAGPHGAGRPCHVHRLSRANSGELKRRATTCVGCHADEKAGPHVKIQCGCENCHRPHSPNGAATPPSCVTCHERTQLPGVHQSTSHQTCIECHQPHGPLPAGRQLCLGCHADRRDHEPDATSCIDCHTFGGEGPWAGRRYPRSRSPCSQ